MWLQIVLSAAAITVAHGMCFGVPLLQQPVACPENMIYYSQLCICIEPKYVERINEIGTVRKVPMLANEYSDPSQTFKSKLDAIRHRLTASLPDMSGHSYGSSVGDVRVPLLVFPDKFFIPFSSLPAMYNNIPRSWKIGGLLESWSNEALAAGEIPTVNTGGVFSAPSWGAGVNDVSTLSLLDRLHTLRSLWKDASQINAENRAAETAMAQEFIKHLPTTGISPDTARAYFKGSGIPDTPQTKGDGILNFPNQGLKMPPLLLKEADYIQQGFEPSPREPIRRANSFLRSALRLQQNGA